MQTTHFDGNFLTALGLAGCCLDFFYPDVPNGTFSNNLVSLL